MSVVSNNLVFGAPIDSVIFEIPVSFESTITITTLIGTSFKVFDADQDSIIAKPSGFSLTNSSATGIYVFQVKDGEGAFNAFSVDSLGNVIMAGDVAPGDDVLLADGAVVGITGNEVMTFNAAGSINVTGATMDVDGAFTATSVGADGDLSAGDDVLLADGSVVGITGNEVITFNAAGSINFTGATVDIDGAFSASSVASDGDVSGTTGTFTSTITDGTYSSDGSGNFSAIGTIATTGAATFGSTGSFESTLTINPTVADAEDPSLILKTDADDDGTVFVSEALTINYAAVADPAAGLWTATTTQSAGFDFDMNLIASTVTSDGDIVATNGNILMGTIDKVVGTNTSDGSDSFRLFLSGGGAQGNSRAGSIFLYGNEFATAASRGNISLQGGAGSGGNVGDIELATLGHVRIKLFDDGDVRFIKQEAGFSIVNNTVIGHLEFFGDDNTASADEIAGQIETIATATWDNGNEDAKMVLNVADGGVLNANQLVLNTDGSLAIGFETILVPNAASNSGTSVADDAAITVVNSIMRMVGADADAVLDTDPAVNDGIADGQIVIIQGTADGNTVTIADNVNTQLAGGASMTLGDGDVLCLMWDSNASFWIEQYRSDN